GAAYGYVGLTSGAAHLIEVFGSPEVREMFMGRLYSGTWTGTMALTEPHAGSSLADVRTRARPVGDGQFAVEGSKVFISGGDQGIGHMFQMMNEARLMVGMNGIATASAAYFESLEYAKTRPQGRRLTSKDPAAPQIPIIEHTDVRRMLLRQKAIVEGGLSLL